MSHLPSIAIVGDFDSGKSTTFDALCDGRYIAPRRFVGFGIMANNIVISAENIDDDERKEGLSEWADVSFKTPRAVAVGLARVLRQPLMGSAAFRKFNANLSDEQFAAAVSTDEGFSELVDLDNVECRSVLKESAETILKNWRNNRDSLSYDEVDNLRIAMLQLRFYGSSEYLNLTSRIVVPIDNYRELISLPKNWMARWMDDSDSQFTLDEVAFIFVEYVLLRIHSETLRHLGCRITEIHCPGLFANAYEKHVVRRTIEKSDMVLYLTHGQKVIGQADLECIRTIGEMGMEGKIQVIANLYHFQELAIDDVIPATKHVFANEGLDIEIHPFNAKLAVLAMQGELLLNHADSLSELDKACMIAEAKVKEANVSLASIWVKVVRRVGVLAELEEVENIDNLNAESVSILRRESLLDDLISSLEQELAG